jgi:hypothetical protein
MKELRNAYRILVRNIKVTEVLINRPGIDGRVKLK